MSRRTIALAVAALAALCAFAPGVASATPQLSFDEAVYNDEGTTVHRGDTRILLEVRLRNSGTSSTTSTIGLSIETPPGVEIGSIASGSNWTCLSATSVCTSSETGVAPGAQFQLLRLTMWLDPAEAPDVLATEIVAFGGGSQAAFGSASYAMAPAKPFEILDLRAAACTLGAFPGPGGAAPVCPLQIGVGSDEYTTAAGHPFGAASDFRLPLKKSVFKDNTPGKYIGLQAVEQLRNAFFELPAGFIGNLNAVPDICTFPQVLAKQCPASAAVGSVDVDVENNDPALNVPLYRIVPEEGYAAAFAIRVIEESDLTYVFRIKLRANGDYGVTVASPLPPQNPRVVAVNRAVLCSYGVKRNTFNNYYFDGCRLPGEPGAFDRPFLTNPTRCGGEAPVTTLRIDSFGNPGALNDEAFPDLSDPNWKSASVASPQNEGCEAITEGWTGVHAPSFTFQPDSDRAGASAGYTAKVHIPKAGLEEEGGLANSHLKDTTVTLPEGIALNPSAADGLGACSLADVGYLGNDFPAPNRIRFKTTAPGCPGNSKVATAEVTTPVLEDTLPGAMYLAAQDENPFGSKFAVYLVVDDPKTGVKATIPGKVMPDQGTGQIKTVFADNPQAPIEDVDIEFFQGPRASLANPDVCGNYAVATEMTPWSAADPYNPQPNEIARPGDTVKVGSPAAGQSSCPGSKGERPFGPGFEAGGDNVFAGAHSKFSLRITRGEGEQELSGVKVMTPPGFAATLKGVEICGQAGIDLAGARSGRAEMANPSCPAASQVGTTTVGAGAGPSPFYVKTGKVYLTGPYKGAPLSFTFVVPAVAGPFDLGVQVVRAALNVDPSTAAVTAVSDPLPQILEGVPLQLRDIRVELDRANFTLNPTNCEPMAITAELTGGSGAVSKVGSRFQVGGCEGLRFKPRMRLQLHGSPKRTKYQRLVAKVFAKPGEANIARTAVTMPHSVFLAQEHIRTVCTRVQFAADACPKGSIYGRAEAESPLLDGKLKGPVYLRSSDNLLPDVVVTLRGPDAQPIEVELAGRVDSKNKGIRTSFELVPDAPVSEFTLRMFGGQKSLLVNSRDLCKGKKQRATVRMLGHNNERRDFRPVVGNDCGKKGKKKKSKASKRRGRAQSAVLSSWPLNVF